MMTGPDDVPNRIILEKLDMLTEVTQGILVHIDRTQSKNEARFDRLERDMDRRFDLVDKRFDEVEKRFDEVDKRFGEVNVRLDRLQAKRRRPKNRE
jgi:hypothetical protein